MLLQFQKHEDKKKKKTKIKKMGKKAILTFEWMMKVLIWVIVFGILLYGLYYLLNALLR